MPFLQPAVAYAYDDKIEIYFNFTERKNPDDSDDTDSRDNNYVNCSDIKNGGTQISFCVPPFLFRYIKSVKSPSRKTTLPETQPSDTPRPSMQWKANYLTTVFTIRLQLCIYCLIDSFKLVSVNRRITEEKQSPQ